MRWTGLTNILYLFTTCLLHVSADSLQYVCTAYTPGMNSSELLTIVGLLNGEQFMCYNRKSTEDWMKKAESEDVWKSHLESMRGFQSDFHNQFTTALQQFNHSKGDPTLQWTYGCERDHGTNSAYNQYGFDGDDLITLDLNTGAWNTSKNPQAVNAKNEWDPEGHQAKSWRSFLNSVCFEWLNSFMSYGRENLERKVRPEVSVFHKQSPSPEVVCHATGFFPKEVNITWQKDGEDVHEDVELRETLPNQDGSFQKRSILKVPAEELQKHNYTCVIQHSSSEEQIVRIVPKGGGSGGAPITIIVVAVVVALIALVVVGVVVWRKNSGFAPVPANEPL